MTSLLENLFLNYSFDSSSSLFKQSLWQDKHLYFIKSSLTFSYSRKQSQSLHLIYIIPSARLSTRFDDEAAINLVLSIDFIFHFVSLFSIGIKKVLFFNIFLKTFKFSLKFPQSSLIIKR